MSDITPDFGLCISFDKIIGMRYSPPFMTCHRPYQWTCCEAPIFPYPVLCKRPVTCKFFSSSCRAKPDNPAAVERDISLANSSAQGVLLESQFVLKIASGNHHYPPTRLSQRVN